MAKINDKVRRSLVDGLEFLKKAWSGNAIDGHLSYNADGELGLGDADGSRRVIAAVATPAAGAVPVYDDVLKRWTGAVLAQPVVATDSFVIGDWTTTGPDYDLLNVTHSLDSQMFLWIVKDAVGGTLGTPLNLIPIDNSTVQFRVAKGAAFAGTYLLTNSAPGGPINMGGTGPPGADGTPGTNGNTVLSGTSDPAGATGVNGDFWFNTVSYDFFKKVTGSWVLQCNLKGSAGAGNDTIQDLGSVGTGFTANPASGRYIKLTLTSDIQIVLPNGSSPTSTETLSFELTQDGVGSHAVSWDDNRKVPGGINPPLSTTAGATDIIDFKWNGSIWLAFNLIQNLKS